MLQPFGRRAAVIAAIAVAGAIASAPAQAEIRLQVLATDPPSSSVLGRWEQFWMRISYTTDQRIMLRAQPYFAGQRVPAPNGGSPIVGPGAGERSLWFAFLDQKKIDTVVVTAETERGAVLAETRFSVSLAWTGSQPATRRVPADWVQRAIDAGQRTAAARKNVPVMSSAWELIVGLLTMAAVPLYFVLQPALLWRLQGGWRTAAALPLALMVPILIYTVIAFGRGSNLAPVLLILASPFAVLYLLGLTAVRRISAA